MIFCPQLFEGLSTDAAAVLGTRKKIDVLDSHMSYLDTGNVSGNDNTGDALKTTVNTQTIVFKIKCKMSSFQRLNLDSELHWMTLSNIFGLGSKIIHTRIHFH